MRCRDFWILASILTSLLFSILTLVAGHKHGVLDSVCMATYHFDVNRTAVGILNSAVNRTTRNFEADYDNELLGWAFNAHYLSICAGFIGGTETEDFGYKACEPRSLGWTFRSDDPFIVHWGQTNDTFPVITAGVPLRELKTSDSARLLVTGQVVTMVAETQFVTALFRWSGNKRAAALIAGVMAIAAIFFTASSALMTARRGSSYDAVDRYRQNHFLGLSWSAAGFMYVALIGQMADVLVVSRKKGRVGDMEMRQM